MDRIADIFAGITMVALVTTIVAHRNTSKVIAAGGKAYADALSAAMSIR
jgi:NAD(P)H-dependent flavin oxidoreductase YrpB (nitropropane dioxygenase family)